MTTLAYSNGFMAADTRATIARSTHHEKAVCLGCGEKHDHVDDNISKLVVPKNVKWRDEPIIAMGGSGNKGMVDQALGIIQNGDDLMAKVEVLREFDEVRGHCSYGLLIVTPTKVIVYRPNEHKKRYERVYKLTDDVAVGSGEDIARFAMQAFGCSVSDAIQSAALTDDHTGGEVHWVDCREGADRTIGKEKILTKEEFKAKMALSSPFPL